MGEYKEFEYDSITFTFKPSSIMDPKNFYVLMHHWMIENNFMKDNAGFEEQFYYELNRPGWKEIEFIWLGKKKYNDYIELRINLNIRIDGLKEVETMFQGKKIKTTSGTIEIIADFKEIFDPQKKLGKNKFVAKHINFFRDRLYKKYLEQAKDENGANVGKFQNFVTEIFNTFKYEGN